MIARVSSPNTHAPFLFYPEGGKELLARNDMFGRKKIFSEAYEITDDNVLDELNQALIPHNFNRGQIDYLWRYYKGEQPILERVKSVRPEITNRIVENRANEIVSFKVGYLCGEPIQYVGRTSGEMVSEGISDLNEMMVTASKSARDKEIVEWRYICGTAFRMVLPSREMNINDSPFQIYTLDPRDTFVVYSVDVDEHPLFGVKYHYSKNYGNIYDVYSDRKFWRISGNLILETYPHSLGCIPIFEYPENRARLGAFEIVLPLLDSINNVDSNRMDAIEQTVQAFIKFINCDITAEDFRELKELGAIKVKSVDGAPADVDVVKNDLDQNQSQITKEDAYNAVLTICGMPNRNGGSSTSDTGAAVEMRDGWSNAEARAKDSEISFKEAERKMLRLILRIIRDSSGLSEAAYSLKLRDITIQFTRRNYENIQSKSQVLTTMLSNDKIHPRLACEHCGMFSDAEDAYRISEEYRTSRQQSIQPMVENQFEINQESEL
mgnify:CR=1 FL=1